MKKIIAQKLARRMQIQNALILSNKKKSEDKKWARNQLEQTHNTMEPPTLNTEAAPEQLLPFDGPIPPSINLQMQMQSSQGYKIVEMNQKLQT